MAELTLHHYAISAFSERVRLAMGLKRLRHRSVLSWWLPMPGRSSSAAQRLSSAPCISIFPAAVSTFAQPERSHADQAADRLRTDGMEVAAPH